MLKCFLACSVTDLEKKKSIEEVILWMQDPEKICLTLVCPDTWLYIQSIQLLWWALVLWGKGLDMHSHLFSVLWDINFCFNHHSWHTHRKKIWWCLTVVLTYGYTYEFRRISLFNGIIVIMSFLRSMNSLTMSSWLDSCCGGGLKSNPKSDH